MHTQLIPYADDDVALEGFAAYPSEAGKSPAVILCHAWSGRDPFICEKAQLIANLGYVGFALDMYGKGILGKSREENTRLKKPFLQDRLFLQRRLLKAFEVVQSLPQVNPDQIIAIGFGFGGLCALDLARSGVNLKGAVSIYGHFEPPPGLIKKEIKTSLLVLHGYLDPIVPPSDLKMFEQEMNEAQVDWQVNLYSDAMHAFTNPHANDPIFGTVYHPASARRAWSAIEHFLAEKFLNKDL